MGVRIAFYETTDGKSLAENFVRTFSEFKKWILMVNENSIKEYNERLISSKVENFLVKANSLKINEISQELLDELIIEFLLQYCDYGTGKANVNLIGPLISRHKYNKSFKIIKKTKDKKLIKYWNYLKVGRSLIDDNDYTEMEYNIIGFWNKNEMEYIKNEIKKIKNNDIGIMCISDVLDEIGEKSELIFNLEI